MRNGILALIAVAMLVGSSAASQNVSINHKNKQVNSCADIDISMGDGPAIRGEQQLTIARGDVRELEITAARNGGIEVSSGDGDAYSVTLCKAVAASQGQQALAGINLARNGNQLSVTGPDDERWVAFFLVKAPKAAALNLHASNGPMSLRNVDGTAKLEAHNGPISIEGCSGTITANAHNGPITLTGTTGSYDLKTVNGPIDLKLQGQSWQGGDVSASAQNGPVELSVAKGWSSPFLVENSRAPASCKADVCSSAEKTMNEEGSRIAFGASPRIKASSQNGPIMVRNTSGKL